MQIQWTSDFLTNPTAMPRNTQSRRVVHSFCGRLRCGVPPDSSRGIRHEQSLPPLPLGPLLHPGSLLQPTRALANLDVTTSAIRRARIAEAKSRPAHGKEIRCPQRAKRRTATTRRHSRVSADVRYTRLAVGYELRTVQDHVNQLANPPRRGGRRGAGGWARGQESETSQSLFTPTLCPGKRERGVQNPPLESQSGSQSISRTFTERRITRMVGTRAREVWSPADDLAHRPDDR